MVSYAHRRNRIRIPGDALFDVSIGSCNLRNGRSLLDRSSRTAGARFATGSGADASGHGFDGGCRSSPHDVCASGDGPLVDLGSSKLDLAMASGVSFSLSGSEQPYSGSAGRDLAGGDGVHGSPTHGQERAAVRRAGIRRAWDWRSAGAWRRHESRCRAKYDLEQSAVRCAANVASDHSAERRESDFGANAVLSFQLAARETAGSSLRQIQHGGFFRFE